VVALSKLFPSTIAPDRVADGWCVVYVELPTGQVSWHVQESELSLFSHAYRDIGNPWDGHTTEEKYARLAALGEGK